MASRSMTEDGSKHVFKTLCTYFLNPTFTSMSVFESRALLIYQHLCGDICLSGNNYHPGEYCGSFLDGLLQVTSQRTLQSLLEAQESSNNSVQCTEFGLFQATESYHWGYHPHQGGFVFGSICMSFWMLTGSLWPLLIIMLYRAI